MSFAIIRQEPHPTPEPSGRSSLPVPGEIRKFIYEELLSLQKPILFSLTDYGRMPLSSEPNTLDPSILRVNKSVYAESTETLYSKNVFAFREESSYGVEVPWERLAVLIAVFLSQIGSNAGLL